MERTRSLVLLAVLLGLNGAANAASVWDESINGDLSNDPAAPTPVTFMVGDNLVSGTMGAPDDARDYLSFSIGPGQSLVALILMDLTSEMGDLVGFHALNAGDSSFIPGPDTADSFLGGNHLDDSDICDDLLPDLAAAPLAGTGFDVPLGPGTYSYVIQQTGMDLNSYSLKFQVVPVPAAAWLFGSALGLLGWLRRRQARA